MTANTYSSCKKRVQDNALLYYKGDITSEVITSIFNNMQLKMDELKEKLQFREKVNMVSIELLQNLYHHAHNQTDCQAIFLISKEQEHYLVTTGNYIKNEGVPSLKKKMDEINSLSPEATEKYYKKMLRDGQIAGKGGGLGMIDIAYRTGNPLVYNFAVVNDNFSFFKLNVVID